MDAINQTREYLRSHKLASGLTSDAYSLRHFGAPGRYKQYMERHKRWSAETIHKVASVVDVPGKVINAALQDAQRRFDEKYRKIAKAHEGKSRADDGSFIGRTDCWQDHLGAAKANPTNYATPHPQARRLW